MGNSLQKDFTISENPISSTPTCQIFSAINKKTKEQVSIFRCKIKNLEVKYGAHQAKGIVSRIKKAANYQLKVRQPNILQVLQAPLESRTDMFIVTEPIRGTIANLVLDEWPDIVPISKKSSFPKISDIEIQYGLAQILEALIYLKKESGVCHLNLSPESIFIGRNGDWKLGGFDFAVYCGQNNGAPIQNLGQSITGPDTLEPEEYLRDPFIFSKAIKGSTVGPGIYSPSLDFSAPEYVTQGAYSFASDVFSFVTLYYFLRNYAYHKEIDPDVRDTDLFKILVANNNLNTYQASISYIMKDSAILAKPFLLSQQQTTIYSCLGMDPAMRLDPQFILKESQLFGDDVNALRCLARIQNMDLETKCLVLKELPTVLSLLPKHVLIERVLPPLIRESRRNAELAVATLPNILALGERISSKKFTTKILPTLGRLFMALSPADIPILCLRSLHVILQKTDDIGKKDFVVPFLARCLQSDIPTVRIEAMRSIESCVSGRNQLLSEEIFRNAILPRIIGITKETSNVIVRQTALETIKNCLHLFDRQALADLIPALEYCLSIDRSRETCNVIISIYALYSQRAHPREIACRLLPQLMLLSVESALEYEDFTIYMSIVKGMLNTIENYRLADLEKVESRRRQQQLVEDFPRETVAASIENNVHPATLPIYPRQTPPTISEDKNISKESIQNYGTSDNVHSPLEEYHADSNIEQNSPSNIDYSPIPEDVESFAQIHDQRTEPNDKDVEDNNIFERNRESQMLKPSIPTDSRRDENFENLLNRIMNEPTTESHFEDVYHDNIEMGTTPTFTSEPEKLLTEVKSQTDSQSKFVTPEQSWFDDVQINSNPIEFFKLEAEEETKEKEKKRAVTTHQSDGDDDMFDSLLAKHTI